MRSTLLQRLAARASPGYHPVYARQLLTALEHRGIDCSGLLPAAELRAEDLAPTATRITHAQLRRLVLAARAQCEDPLLAFEWGALIREGMHGAPGTAVLTAPDLRQAIVLVARFGPLRGTIVRPQLVESGEEARVEIREALPRDDQHDFLFCAIAALLAQLLGSLLGPAARQLRIELPVPAPAWSAAAQAMLPGTLRFRAPHLRFAFPRRLLERACPGADAHAHLAALRLCELDATAPTGGVSAHVAALLAWHSGTFPGAQQMARKLGASERSFSRALEAEGTSYRELVDTARRQAAHRLLLESGASVEQVAVQLGYADTSNFIRAFRRWHGCTPQQYRQATG